MRSETTGLSKQAVLSAARHEVGNPGFKSVMHEVEDVLWMGIEYNLKAFHEISLTARNEVIFSSLKEVANMVRYHCNIVEKGRKNIYGEKVSEAKIKHYVNLMTRIGVVAQLFNGDGNETIAQLFTNADFIN